MEVRDLSPKAVWNNFEDLNAVPRASKKEEQVREFIIAFGKKLGLPVKVDAIGNVVITKPATKGMENRKKVALQSHLDMVHQKNSDTVFDFATQGIQSYIDGEWVKAKGTTLGADNGMGVASIMSVLESNDIAHPDLEAFFTIDEETGMTGALNLQEGFLSADILLNLDTEEDNELCIGCAGGMDTTAILDYTEENCPTDFDGLKISITGLLGGHSGVEIHLEKGNANKIMNRILFLGTNLGLRVSSINGGSLRNAIPREAFAVCAIPSNSVVDIVDTLEQLAKTIATEFEFNDAGIKIEFAKTDAPAKVMHFDTQKSVINALYLVPNGVFRVSPGIAGLVETSNNLAKIELQNGKFTCHTLQRSSVESGKEDISTHIRIALESCGASVSQSGSYPGWRPNPESKILAVMEQLYKDTFQENPHVMACHAGLECGIIGSKSPNMEMISFGPTIRSPHSPDEKVNIKSVQKFWNFLQKTLENIPAK